MQKNVILYKIYIVYNQDENRMEQNLIQILMNEAIREGWREWMERTNQVIIRSFKGKSLPFLSGREQVTIW